MANGNVRWLRTTVQNVSSDGRKGQAMRTRLNVGRLIQAAGGYGIKAQGDDSTFQKSLETMIVGMTLVVVAEGVITTNPYFSESEIKKYLRIRKQYHKDFLEACQEVADRFEGTAFNQVVLPLRQLLRLLPTQTSRIMTGIVRAFRTLYRMPLREIEDIRVLRVFKALRIVVRMMDRTEREEYYYPDREFKELFETAIKITDLPPQIKTLFRKIAKLGGGASAHNVPEEPDPGAWFDFSQDKKEDIRQRLQDAKKREEDAFKIEDVDERTRVYRQIAQEIANLQGEAGVNQSIINREDREPLDKVLFRESKQEASGPVTYVVNKFVEDLEGSMLEYPTYYVNMTPRELGKLKTVLRKVSTLETFERIVKDYAGRGVLPKSYFEDVEPVLRQVKKNKAVRDGIPLASLTFEPITEEQFQEKHDAGEIVFAGGYSDEDRQKLLGRVSRAIGDLETVYGSKFAGKHARKLSFVFEEGESVGMMTGAYYNGWGNKDNKWHPKVVFGKRFDSLLAHELSHYFDDLLAFRIEKATVGLPDYQFGDIAHGRGDIFGTTGVSLDYTLELVNNPDDKKDRWWKLVEENVPELPEFVRVVAASPDYQRWKDLIPGAYDLVIERALREVAGIEYGHPDYYRYTTKVTRKSELPPGVAERADTLYNNMMSGDDRKLSYKYSSVEIWARMCEQYVYHKLSDVGIANPWLTQMTYDIDEHPEFMDGAYFEEHLKPVFDRLFDRLKEKKILARVVSVSNILASVFGKLE